MTARARRVAVVLAGLLVLGGAARGQDRLDLSIRPGDVEHPGEPAVLEDPSPEAAADVPEAGGEGWIVRPEVDLDLRHDESGEGALGTIDPELESLGLRLERAW